MTMRLLSFVSIAVIMAAGCTSSPALSSTSETSATEPPSVTGPTATSSNDSTPILNAPVPNAMALNACVGIAYDSVFPASGPGRAPPGWESRGPPEQLATHVSGILYRCQRISWGPFERGPIHIMFEGHDNATAAPRCLETEYNLPFILNALWIDDAEIGAYLNSTYGMPVRIAAFTSTNVTGSPAEADFRWSVDNGPENHLFARDLNIDPSAGRYISKWIWTHAGGITYLDLDKTLFTSSYEQQVAPGELYPPMLYREAVPSSPYIGTVVLHQNVDATGKIFRFNDYMCEEPADEGS